MKFQSLNPGDERSSSFSAHLHSSCVLFNFSAVHTVSIRIPGCIQISYFVTFSSRGFYLW